MVKQVEGGAAGDLICSLETVFSPVVMIIHVRGLFLKSITVRSVEPSEAP